MTTTNPDPLASVCSWCGTDLDAPDRRARWRAYACAVASGQSVTGSDESLAPTPRRFAAYVASYADALLAEEDRRFPAAPPQERAPSSWSPTGHAAGCTPDGCATACRVPKREIQP